MNRWTVNINWLDNKGKPKSTMLNFDSVKKPTKKQVERVAKTKGIKVVEIGDMYI